MIKRRKGGKRIGGKRNKNKNWKKIRNQKEQICFLWSVIMNQAVRPYKPFTSIISFNPFIISVNEVIILLPPHTQLSLVPFHH